LAYLSDAIDDSGRHDLAIAVAYKKVNQTWGQILLQGIGANLMVCVSVWQATCAEEVAGKVLALWFPVTGFVAMGFDHVVANQFFIPLGMMLGADISVKTLLFDALLPATIGNAIGGGIFVGAVYWFVFDSMNATNKVMGSISTRRLPNPNDRQGQSPPPSPQRSKRGLKHRSVSVTVGDF
jgi:formate/nitrite transporter